MSIRPGRPVGGIGLDTLADRVEAAATIYDHAACYGKPTSIFFPDLTKRSGRIPEGGRPDPYADARPICDRCPVWEACLEFALANRETDGFWGRHDPAERKVIIDARKLGASS